MAEDRSREFTWNRRWYIGIASFAAVVSTHIWVLLLVGLPGRHGAALFKWHPILMSLSTFIVLPCGMFAWTYWRESTPEIKTQQGEIGHRRILFKALHVVSVITAFATVSIGIAVAYVSHVQQGFVNLYSFHSWVGATTLILMKINLIGGIISTLWNNTHEVLGGTWHRNVGILIFAMSFASATLGFAEYQTFIVRDKGPWSAAATFSAILASLTMIIGICYVYELTSSVYSVGIQIVPGGTIQKSLAPVDQPNHAPSVIYPEGKGVPAFVNIDTEMREISSGSGTSS